ncbi:hypothetical protein BVC80_1289g54 [Macleaya cordata]|uniref:DUF7138 domain-containing protein n=1 Tax=Macleaya cordata TaxID=56857 RepID=A0A200Q9K6_MACCD|nr:hypothetical protein BVC80_1289g54 [Macleaya cordata]
MSEMASFPVVFFDGEREVDIGNVGVHPALEFKKFQSIVSQKIGISPHQISISLICRKKSRSSGTRKVPINEKVNFGLIVLEKDCYFYAVLKRSRREKRGKPRPNLVEEDYFSASPIDISQNKYSISPPEKMILRRDQVFNPSQLGFVSPVYDQITSPESFYKGLGFHQNYENQLRSLQIQRDNNYLMSAISYPYTDMEDEYIYGRNSDRISKGIIVCQECAKGRPIPFHWCVYDTITVGFRSPAGPIARPSKV